MAHHWVDIDEERILLERRREVQLSLRRIESSPIVWPVIESDTPDILVQYRARNLIRDLQFYGVSSRAIAFAGGLGDDDRAVFLIEYLCRPGTSGEVETTRQVVAHIRATATVYRILYPGVSIGYTELGIQQLGELDRAIQTRREIVDPTESAPFRLFEFSVSPPGFHLIPIIDILQEEFALTVSPRVTGDWSLYIPH